MNLTEYTQDIVGEAIKILAEYRYFCERDERVIYLACLDCRDNWIVRIPQDSISLQEVVRENGSCLCCGSYRVVRGGV